MDGMCVSLQNPNVEALIPSVKVLGGGDFGRWVGHGGGTLMNGIGAPTRGDKKACSGLQHVRMEPENGCLQTKEALNRHRICGHFDFGLPNHQNCKKE